MKSIGFIVNQKYRKEKVFEKSLRAYSWMFSVNFLNLNESGLLEEMKKMMVLKETCHNISYSTRSTHVDISNDFYLDLISRTCGHFRDISEFISAKWPLFLGMNFMRNSGYTNDICTSLPLRRFPITQYFTSLYILFWRN